MLRQEIGRDGQVERQKEKERGEEIEKNEGKKKKYKLNEITFKI